MNHTITNAAGITILEPLDNNFKTGGGPVSIGGCVVVASKGKPFVPLEIQPESTWSGGKTSLEQILGSPLSKKAYGMEGLRQLSDACKECSWVNAVRVVSTKGYRYPSLAFLMFRDLKTAWATDTSYKPGDLVTDADKQWVCAVAHVASAANKPGTETGEWLPFSGPVETAAHRYNEEVLVGDDGFWMVFYPIDGCDCQKRTVRIEDVDTARQRFTLSIYEKDDAGYESLLEGYEVGIGEDDKDDMGRPAYIETVFETRSSHFRCDFLEGTAWEDLEPILLSLEWKKSTPQLFSFSGARVGRLATGNIGIQQRASPGQPSFRRGQRGARLHRKAGGNRRRQAHQLFLRRTSVPFPFAGIGVGQGVGAEEPPCALLLFSP